MIVRIFLYGTLILATILGVNGPSIGYFMTDHVVDIHALYYLVAVTFISIFLFLLAPFLALIFMKKGKVQRKEFHLYIVAVFMLGLPTSFWSYFVLVMGWP